MSILPAGKVREMDGGVGVRMREVAPGENVAGYAGLSTCGRIWLCPVCNSKVMALRSLEIGSVLTWAEGEGHQVLWGSLTCHHDPTSPLEWLLNVQREAWRHVVQSKMWKANRDLRVGYVRASEITTGAAGWHPHFHPIIILRASDPARAQRYAALIVQKWIEGVRIAGGNAAGGNAQQLKVLRPGEFSGELAWYVTKGTYVTSSKLALEAVWSQSKTGERPDGRTMTRAHWTLLDGASDTAPEQVISWWELEDATTGHRMITWSRDLRQLAGLNEERTDEDVAAEDIGSADDTVFHITANGWRAVRSLPVLQAGILEVLEQRGWDGARQYLDLHRIEYLTLAQIDTLTEIAEAHRPVGGEDHTARGPDVLSLTFKLNENITVMTDDLADA